VTRGRLSRFEEPGGFVGYRSPALAALGVPHVFTTRRGDGRDLDLGDLGAANVAALMRAVGTRGAARAGEPDGARLVALRQVHGSAVFVAGAELPAERPQADASVGDRPDRLLLVRTADCVPILIAGDGGRRVAAVHAGWRGLVAGVIARALEALGPADAAAIGPCISVGRFEVGAEVAHAFESAGLGDAVVGGGPGAKPRVDLARAARAELARAGVRAIDGCELCTWDDPELYSHRRDVTHGGRPTTGRLGAAILPAVEARSAR